MFALVASALSLCYLFGFFIQLLVNAAILSKTDWKKMPGLTLIASLGISDMSASLAFGVGCLQAAIGKRFVPLDGYIEGSLSLFCWTTGSLHMMALSYNRLIAIVWSTRYTSWCAPRQTATLILLCWLTAIVATSVNQAMAYPVKFFIESASDYNDFDRNLTDFRAAEVLAVFYDWLSLIALIVPLAAYLLITVFLVKHKLSVGDMESSWDLSLCLQFFIVVAVYAFSSAGWYVLWPYATHPVVGVLLRVGALLNFTVNGYVYLIFNKTIRSAVRKLFGEESNNNSTRANAKSKRSSRHQPTNRVMPQVE